MLVGFRRGRSPLDSIIDLTTSAEKYRASRRSAAAVFLEVEGALDSVCHDAILSTLEHNGLGGSNILLDS